VRAGAPFLTAAAVLTLPAALAAQWGSSALAQGSPALIEYIDVVGDWHGAIATPGSADCVLFETLPGQKLAVSVNGGKGFDPFLVIGTGTSCDNKIRVYGRNDDFNRSTDGFNSKIEFIAGGGTYIAQVSGTQKTTGDYAIAVRNSTTATRKYAPGLALPRVIPPQFVEGVSASTAPLSGRPLPAAGSSVKDCAECPELVVVKTGSFFMGSSAEEEGHQANEGPRHQVRIAQPFAIGKYEVTLDEWDTCVKENGCGRVIDVNNWGRGRRPAFGISWSMANQYVRWLRRKTGQNYYLPSEAEWEYAARAGTTTPWNTGSALITDDANIMNALGRTVPVGSYPANAFGLHDTHGNVSEWVADCYEIGYFGTPRDGSAMAMKGCQARVFRGGSYFGLPPFQRSSNRGDPVPFNELSPRAGLRVARSL